MGHISKFTFPLPGRRQKPQPSQPVPAHPFRSGQRMIVATKLTPDAGREPLSERSNSLVSGISISVSDSTSVSYQEQATGLGIMPGTIENLSGKAPGAEHLRRWDEESRVIPLASIPAYSMYGESPDDRITDGSSLRRPHSSSTLVSYYDKAKLPLSISQQTSNSAMAKGLPPKAKAILDMDGSLSPPVVKKKPSKLDLTHLLPRARMSRLLAPESHSRKSFVLGPDMMTRSPSMMSESPDTTPPLVQQRTEKPGKRSAKDTLRSLLPAVNEYRPSSSSRNSHAQHGHQLRSSVSLQHLYDHYERRTFQDATRAEPVPEELPIRPQPAVPVSSNHPAQPRGAPNQRQPASASPGRLLTSVAGRPDQRQHFPHQPPTVSSLRRPASPASIPIKGPGSPPKSSLNTVSLPSESLDCGTSISSRHTRTSRASKYTDRSVTDLDLQMNSVLSLSSDSEEESVDTSGKQSLYMPSPSSSQSGSLRGSARAEKDEVEERQMSERTRSASQTSQFLSVPEKNGVPPHNPRINTRSSSLATALCRASQKAPSPSPTQHISTRPTASRPRTTNATPAINYRPASRGSLSSIPESRPAASNPQQSGHPPQETPPLSPTSMDFYLDSHRASLVPSDVRSMRSSVSVSTASIRSKSDAVEWDDGTSGRLMAVTRQEEMLLAALRKKRAQIRENMISELGEEQSQSQEPDTMGGSRGLSHPRPRSRHSHNALASMSRHSSRSTIRAPDTQAQEHRTVKSQGSQLSLRSSQGRKIVDPVEKAPERGRILLMLDRPTEVLNAFDAAEPSPDLSEFLDFDAGSEEFPQRSHSSRSDAYSGPSLSSASRSPSSHGRLSLSEMAHHLPYPGRTDPDRTRSPEFPGDGRPAARRVADLHVEIMDESFGDFDFPGVPRPDSPISPSDMDIPIASSITSKRKAARLSAVGQNIPGMEAGWWGDDG